MRAAAYAALLVSCYRPPAGAVPADPAPVEAAFASFQAARGPVGCGYLGRVLLVDGDADQTARMCGSGAPINACVYVTGGLEPWTLIYVRSDVPPGTRDRLIVHETLHAARGCWVEEGGSIAEGWPEGGCPRSLAQDREHCDAPLWGDVQRDAVSRLSDGGP